MKTLLRLVFFVALFSAIHTARAQIIPTGFAVVQNPAGVYYVFSAAGRDPTKGIFYYINYTTAEFDSIPVGISSTGAFSGSSSSSGRTISGQIGSTSISLNYNGVSLTPPKESVYGPTATFAGMYYGTLYDSTGANAASVLVSSHGEFLAFAEQGNAFDLGIGSIDEHGNVVLPLRSGRTARGTFAPENGVAQGTLSLSTGDTAQYGLTKGIPSRLANISTRGVVGSGEQVLIGGFILEGGKTVLINAKGPSLGSQGIADPVSNPRVDLYKGDTLVASNTDWQLNSNASEIAASGAAPSDPREASLQVALAPGAYTVKVSSEDATTGIGLVEVYGVGTPTGH